MDNETFRAFVWGVFLFKLFGGAVWLGVKAFWDWRPPPPAVPLVPMPGPTPTRQLTDQQRARQAVAAVRWQQAPAGPQCRGCGALAVQHGDTIHCPSCKLIYELSEV